MNVYAVVLVSSLLSPVQGKDAPPRIELLRIPKITVQRQAISSQETARIKTLILNLAKIDSPDMGLSSTMSGTAFAPIAGQESAGMMVLTNHHLKRNSDLTELVKLGSRALPLLLDHLDDKTPTKLTIRAGGIIGTLMYEAELSGNPANAREAAILKAMPARKRSDRLGVEDPHTVTVGDVCFVIIGQIVSRKYQAVRYQPSGILIVNSPTERPEIARTVRAIWSSSNPSQTLFDSLMLDYSTLKVESKTEQGPWDTAARISAPAATRLLYYFPKEFTPTCVKWLNEGNGGLDHLKAVAWCQEPVVHAALVKRARETSFADVLIALLSGMGPADKAVVVRRAREFIITPGTERPGPFGTDYELLMWLANKAPAESLPIFQRYLTGGGLVKRRTVCAALKDAQPAWKESILAPLLADKRSFGWSYAVTPGNDNIRLPIRVCDEAAEAIVSTRKSLSFHMQGKHADLDRQIEAIKAAPAPMKR